MANGEQAGSGPSRPTQSRVAIVAVVIVAAAVGAWLLAKGGDNGNNSASTTSAQAPTQANPRGFPVIMSRDGLRTFVGTLAHDVYWAGPQSKLRYEVTLTSSGNVYVRYLPAGVQVGNGRPDFLTVGSYPQPDPMKTLQEAAKRPGAIVHPLPGGGRSVTNTGAPKSVYLAYNGSPVLIEVYDPNPQHARQIVASGSVKPVV